MPEARHTDVEERPALRLSFSQLTAASLATVSGAVAASFLGIYGTIIGTAVMSVVSTAGGVIYQHYLDRTRRRLRTSRIGTLTRMRAVRVDDRETADSAARPGAGEAGETPAQDGEIDQRERAGLRGAVAGILAGLRRRWRVAAGTAGAAVLVFGFAIGVISVMESLADKPTAKILTGQPGSGTTFGRTVGAQGPVNARVGTGSTPSPGTSTPDGSRPSPLTTPTVGPNRSPSSQPAPPPSPKGGSAPATEDSDSDARVKNPGTPPTP